MIPKLTERYRLIFHANQVYRFDPFNGFTWIKINNDWIEIEEKDAKTESQQLIDRIQVVKNI